MLQITYISTEQNNYGSVVITSVAAVAEVTTVIRVTTLHHELGLG